MNLVLQEEQDMRKNTGANCIATWTNSAPGGRRGKDIEGLAGNSANAELAAGQRALTVHKICINYTIYHFDCILQKVFNHHLKLFTQLHVPLR